MSVLQELDAVQIDELINAAVDKAVPVIITISQEKSWANLHSRVAALWGSHMLLEMPCAELTGVPHEFAPAERVGVSFKLKHHKYIFSATVVGQERIAQDDGSELPVLAVVAPARMQRLQRRAFLRADVPDNRIVRASFWMGGRDCEPAGTDCEHPVWSGQVVNISAGGFQLAVDPNAARILEEGDCVGLRLVFGTGGETVYADAQFRHAELIDGRAQLGFQFLGLTETAAGRVALQLISVKVAEFQNQSRRGGSFRNN